MMDLAEKQKFTVIIRSPVQANDKLNSTEVIQISLSNSMLISGVLRFNALEKGKQ